MAKPEKIPTTITGPDGKSVDCTCGQCIACGDHGIISGSGFCADCIRNGINTGTDVIGASTIQRCRQALGDLLSDNQRRINDAYLSNDALTVSLSLKFSPGKNPSDVVVDAAISYTAEKIKEGNSFVVNERQGRLPGVE